MKTILTQTIKKYSWLCRNGSCFDLDYSYDEEGKFQSCVIYERDKGIRLKEDEDLYKLVKGEVDKFINSRSTNT